VVQSLAKRRRLGESRLFLAELVVALLEGAASGAEEVEEGVVGLVVTVVVAAIVVLLILLGRVVEVPSDEMSVLLL